jgi:hypothetical protein
MGGAIGADVMVTGQRKFKLSSPETMPMDCCTTCKVRGGGGGGKILGFICFPSREFF